MKNSYNKERRTGYVFLLIFILLAAGIVTGGYFAYRNYEKNYRSEVERQLSAIADLKVDQLVQWRKERLGDANVFYKNNVFSDLVKRYFKNQADADAKRRIQAWMGQNSTENIYNRICLHDIAGTERISFPEGKIHTPFIFSVRSAEVLKSGKVEFQDFYRDENDKKVYLTIFVPILDEYDNRKTLGLLALRIDPTQYLYPMIEKWPTLSKTSETLIIRRDGNDVLFLNDLKFYKDAALNLRIPLERKDVLAVKAVLGIEGVVEGRDYRGEQVVGVVHAVPDSPWFLVARMDMGEVYVPLRERLWLMIVLIGALLVGAGASVGLVWRQERSRFYREKYKSAEALEKSQSLLAATEKIGNIGGWEFDIDTKQQTWTEEVYRIHELDITYQPTVETGVNFYTPASKPIIERAVQLAIEQGEPFNVELEIITAKGNLRCVHVIGKVDRERRKVFGFFQDITERKRAEEAQRESKELAIIKKTTDEASEFAENVINTVREPLLALDQDLRVVKVSRSFYEFFKVKPEETVGHLIYDLGNKQWDIPKLRELLETILPQKASFDNYEVEHDFATIGKRTMLLNARQIQQASGKERIILLAIEDITERKEIEAGLEKTRKELVVANKELEAFSYSVSHDLRAPLRHISGYVELLVKHFKSELSEKGVHYLDSIADSAHQMGKLIDTLLQFSRIGRAEMHRSQLEMNEIVQEVVESVSKDNPDREIEWVVRKLPSVSGDDATLRLVWINLLSNAAKFTRTRKDASIEIGAKDETKEVIYFVKDNGVGFDIKYAQKLFGVFQRLHPTEEFEGTGIGLANVNRIVVRHGGRAWAEAEVNKGATFYFSIPK